eukprot:TRINITY_DN47186_c0_g1_i3.p1 TRINITY_DN47186_c0_g1~~TRINITY_DN47186_c0_g1_i3.p1  ORF type:complete len:963 (+),score=306.46 TRINITY_DN47186_c0_g1_i3:123-3011(+)
MAADVIESWETRLRQLEAAMVEDGQDVEQICKELLEVARGLPEDLVDPAANAGEAGSGGNKALELARRLERQLPRVSEGQRSQLLESFAVLRSEMRRSMQQLTDNLNEWLREAPGAERGTPQLLAQHFEAIAEAPQLRYYRQCGDLDVKTRFLMAIASAIRVATDPALLRSYVGVHPAALSLAQRLTSTFFVAPVHGTVLGAWLDARLERYNRTWQRAAERAMETFREELRARFASVLVPPSAPGMPAPKFKVSKWPMGRCALAQAFLKFVEERGVKVEDDISRPPLKECPMLSLKPEVVLRLLQQLGGYFEVFNETDQATAGTVRLGPDALAALEAQAKEALAAALAASGGKKLGAAAQRALPAKAPPPKQPPPAAAAAAAVVAAPAGALPAKAPFPPPPPGMPADAATLPVGAKGASPSGAVSSEPPRKAPAPAVATPASPPAAVAPPPPVAAAAAVPDVVEVVGTASVEAATPAPPTKAAAPPVAVVELESPPVPVAATLMTKASAPPATKPPPAGGHRWARWAAAPPKAAAGTGDAAAATPASSSSALPPAAASKEAAAAPPQKAKLPQPPVKAPAPSPGASPEAAAEAAVSALPPRKPRAFTTLPMPASGAAGRDAAATAGASAVGAALGFEAAAEGKASKKLLGEVPNPAEAKEAVAAPQILGPRVRRKFKWADMDFLRRLVRRSLKVIEWSETWAKFCDEKKAPGLPSLPYKVAEQIAEIRADARKRKTAEGYLTEFVERNLAQFYNSEWAEDLLYTRGKQDEPIPPSPAEAAGSDSASEDGAAAAQVGGAKRSRSRDSSSSGGQVVAAGTQPSTLLAPAPQAVLQAPGALVLGEPPAKKAKKDKKEKKQEKKRKKEEKAGKATPSMLAAAPAEDDESSGNEDLGPMPQPEHRTKWCHAFLKGQCYKAGGVGADACPLAHSESELRDFNQARRDWDARTLQRDRRKSTRLNSSHV